MWFWEYIEQYYIRSQMFSMPITECFFWLCCIITFYPVKLTKKSILWILLQFVVIEAVFIVIKALLRQTGFNVTYIYVLFGAIYAFAVGFRKPINTFIRFSTFSTAYVYGTAFAKAAGGVLYNNILHLEYTQSISYIFIAIIVPVVLVTHTVLIKVCSLDKHEQIGLVWLMPTLIVALFANIAKLLVDNIKGAELPFFGLNELESALFIFLLGVLLYLFNVLCYYLCFHQGKELERRKSTEERLSALMANKDSTEDAAIVFQNSMEEMRAIRHDIKNQLAYLQIMMDSKDYSHMEEYFRELNKGFSATLNLSDCENITVRNILNLELYRARQNNVQIDSRLIIPEKLDVADVDLTTVLLNLLDNAIEACVEDKCSESVIEFNMRQQDSYLFINVTNPVADDAKKGRRIKLQTHKPQKELHGRGTKIIAAIAEKYGGVFSHKIENGKFVADVMLVCNNNQERSTDNG